MAVTITSTIFKRCPHCDRYKSAGLFSTNGRKRDGKNVYCNECVATIAKARAERRSLLGEYIVVANKRCSRCKEVLPRSCFCMDRRRKDALSVRCRDCSKTHKGRSSKAQAAKRTREYRLRCKAKTIHEYGGQCVCCGESRHGFLSIDHVNGNGSIERRARKVSKSIWISLKRMGYPKDEYQLLCFNCNLGRAYNGGICPHNT